MGPPYAVKAARTVTTGGMGRRIERYRALSLPTGLMIKTDEVSEQVSCPREGTKMNENGVGLASIEYRR
jgi:hypothetical protein